MKSYSDSHNPHIVYEVLSSVPKIDRARPRQMVRALLLYGMYRNGLYNKRIAKPLDADVAVYPTRFEYEHKYDADLNKDKSLKDQVTANNHLYHYAAHVSAEAMHELYKDKDGQCCVAYEIKGNNKIPKGFIVFYERTINEKKMVYISHVSVGAFRQGICTKMMQAIIRQYPEATDFYLCVRKSNPDAIHAYEKLGFKEDNQYVTAYDYKPEYFIGMSHRITLDDLHVVGEALHEETKPAEDSYFHSSRFAPGR